MERGRPSDLSLTNYKRRIYPRTKLISLRDPPLLCVQPSLALLVLWTSPSLGLSILWTPSCLYKTLKMPQGPIDHWNIHPRSFRLLRERLTTKMSLSRSTFTMRSRHARKRKWHFQIRRRQAWSINPSAEHPSNKRSLLPRRVPAPSRQLPPTKTKSPRLPLI